MRLAVLIFAVAVTGTAFAQTNTSTALDPLYQCASITADQERLACFDRTVASLRAEGVVTLDREQMQALQQEAFGQRRPFMANLFSGESDDVVGVEAQVTRVYASSGGYGTFELSNGQIWRKTETGRFSNVNEGDTVTVHRAALGSYMLSPERGQGHRVRRVE